MYSSKLFTEIMRRVFAAAGALLALLAPALPYFAICTMAIFYDCVTAWSLARRAARASHRSMPKFSSRRFGRVVTTLLKSWALIALAYLMQTHITDSLPVDLTKVAAGAICFWQLWSILENESSCNGARWARIAQKVLLDKTQRHFEVDLTALESEHSEHSEHSDSTNK